MAAPLIPPPFAPAQLDAAIGAAVKALIEGTATPQQQKKAMKWIIEEACETYGLGWHPGGEGAAAFVAGRRFAGLQIIKALKIQQSVLTKKEEQHG